MIAAVQALFRTIPTVRPAPAQAGRSLQDLSLAELRQVSGGAVAETPSPYRGWSTGPGTAAQASPYRGW